MSSILSIRPLWEWGTFAAVYDGEPGQFRRVATGDNPVSMAVFHPSKSKPGLCANYQIDSEMNGILKWAMFPKVGDTINCYFNLSMWTVKVRAYDWWNNQTGGYTLVTTNFDVSLVGELPSGSIIVWPASEISLPVEVSL